LESALPSGNASVNNFNIAENAELLIFYKDFI
jgi:hypothetical protein